MLFFRKRKNLVNTNDITEKNLNTIIDYTLLKPVVTNKELINFLCVAHKNRYYSVCVNPVNIYMAKRYIESKLKDSLKLCCVIGFPLGENLMETKVYEAKKAIADGADELDVVMSISRAKAGDWKYVREEIARIVRISRGKIVKVIIETALLTKTEIEKASMVCVKAKADFVKTSTGYADGGATPEIVEIIKSVVKNNCGIKASGGITSVNDALNLVRMGATRIGTSRNL